MTQYPVTLEPDDNGTILVSFPDIPEAVTCGDNEADALIHAQDALITALMIYIEDRRTTPWPSVPRRRQKAVALPLLAEAKVMLSNAMIERRMRKSDLARSLGVHMPQVDRLLNLRHSSRIEMIEEALHAVGKQLTIAVTSIAA
jgi:antitoxin HicB